MIKRNGQRIAAITMAVALMGQNVTPIFSLENLTETAKVEDEAKNEETITLDQAEEETESLTEEEYEETTEVESENEHVKETTEVELENDQVEETESVVFEESIEKANSAKATIDFKVLATSDLHANLMNYDYYTGSETNNSGLVKAATVIKEQKKQANKSSKSSVDNVLLVDNGDTIQGTPLANLYAIKQPVKPGQKYPVYEALESLGYDMTTIGNHEVNYGMDFIKQITAANTSMGMVCANLKDAKSGKLVFDPYKILTETVVDSNGDERELKIGITGVVPTQILNWDKVILNGEVTVDEMDEAVKKYTKEMKNKGADIVVVLAHT